VVAADRAASVTRRDAGGVESGLDEVPANASLADTIRAVLKLGKAVKAAAKQSKEGSVQDSVEVKVSLRDLLPFIKPEARPLGVSVATLGVTTAVSLLFPYAIGRILDIAISPDPVMSTATLSIGLLGLFTLQSAMITLRSALQAISGERIAASIRKSLFSAIMAQPIAWFDAQRTGDILNRLSADATLIQKALAGNVAQGLRSASMALGSAAMLFSLSPSLAALSLVLIPPVALAGVTYGRFVQGAQAAVQRALGKTLALGEEAVGAVRTVRAFSREATEAARFASAVDEAYVRSKTISNVAAAFDGAVHMAANVSLIAVLWYGSHLISTQALTVGELTSFLMYSLYVGFNAGSLSTVYTDLKKAAGAAARILAITNARPDVPLSSSPTYWQDAARAAGY
ncbi:hypothetical protein EON68_03640, partial [archaeon]